MFCKCFTIYHSLFCQQKACLTVVGNVGPDLTTVPHLWQFLSLRSLTVWGRLQSKERSAGQSLHHLSHQYLCRTLIFGFCEKVIIELNGRAFTQQRPGGSIPSTPITNQQQSCPQPPSLKPPCGDQMFPTRPSEEVQLSFALEVPENKCLCFDFGCLFPTPATLPRDSGLMTF